MKTPTELKKKDMFWNSEKGEWQEVYINPDGNIWLSTKDIKLWLVKINSK